MLTWKQLEEYIDYTNRVKRGRPEYLPIPRFNKMRHTEIEEYEGFYLQVRHDRHDTYALTITTMEDGEDVYNTYKEEEMLTGNEMEELKDWVDGHIHDVWTTEQQSAFNLLMREVGPERLIKYMEQNK